MTVHTESIHAGECLVSEVNGYISREKISVGAGENLQACTVLGKSLVGEITSLADGGNTGNGSLGDVIAGKNAEIGDYELVAISPTAFDVYSPSGLVLKPIIVGVAYSSPHINLTITAGSTPFEDGDSFTVSVGGGSGIYKKLDLAATDGTQKAAGILFDEVDATEAVASGLALVRLCEINDNYLTWPDGINESQKAKAFAELAENSVIVRS